MICQWERPEELALSLKNLQLRILMIRGDVWFEEKEIITVE